MSREDRVQLVYWCKSCGLTSMVTNEMNTCAFCQGELKEIGWVEEA
jgi:hypothetical protein